MYRRLLVIAVSLATVALFSVGFATASSTVAWQATFNENFGGPNHSPFVCASGPGTLCASGQVVGLGRADEFIVFGGCGPVCDVRTLTFSDGSTLVLDETDVPGSFRTPGNSGNAPGQAHSYGEPNSLDRTDVVVGGSGRFAGATGGATAHIKVAGGVAIIQLSGTVTF